MKVGLGWDTTADIDASVILMDKNKKKIDQVWFRQLKSKDGAVTHSGDNLTGEGDGDDEIISIDLNKLNKKVHYIWPVINIYSSGKSFNNVKGAFCRIYDAASNVEFCRFDLSQDGQVLPNTCNGNIVANFSKVGDNWILTANGYYTKGTQTYDKSVPFV